MTNFSDKSYPVIIFILLCGFTSAFCIDHSTETINIIRSLIKLSLQTIVFHTIDRAKSKRLKQRSDNFTFQEISLCYNIQV